MIYQSEMILKCQINKHSEKKTVINISITYVFMLDPDSMDPDL